MIVALLVLSCLASLGACIAAGMAWRTASRPGQAVDAETLGRLYAVEQAIKEAPRDIRDDLSKDRQELKQALSLFHTDLNTALGRNNQDLLGSQKDLRERTEAALKGLGEKLDALILANTASADLLRDKVGVELNTLREGNEKKLDEMKGVVDEKLSATLDQRLGEKFKTVSDHLEAVHKGLGEMQALASDVGGLKRVLTNVKARGGWGELRLGQLLADMLTPDQYESQVAVRAGAGERVDFAIKLPGRGEAGDAPLWLPIDAKFPQEDYDRLQTAHEQGGPAEIEAAATALERAVRAQAKSICAKYVHPPHTTDFAILYLPTEGLFAEVIRRPGLVSDLQAAQKIMVTGPTTLAAILNSLTMGFQTLAMEKRSAEVWDILRGAKAEFRKYGEVWGRLGEKLDQAKGIHESVAVRTRAVERTLRGVEDQAEAPPALATETLLSLASPATEDESEAA